jgi:hypothetical protein
LTRLAPRGRATTAFATYTAVTRAYQPEAHESQTADGQQASPVHLVRLPRIAGQRVPNETEAHLRNGVGGMAPKSAHDRATVATRLVRPPRKATRLRGRINAESDGLVEDDEVTVPPDCAIASQAAITCTLLRRFTTRSMNVLPPVALLVGLMEQH